MSIWDDRDPRDGMPSAISAAIPLLQYGALPNTTLAAILKRLSKPAPMAWYLDQLGDA